MSLRLGLTLPFFAAQEKSYRTGSADSVGYVRIDKDASRSGFPMKLKGTL
eukprot:COSAG01_NODE_65492_length_273_cov_0.591954_1_plen_49_part_01